MSLFEGVSGLRRYQCQLSAIPTDFSSHVYVSPSNNVGASCTYVPPSNNVGVRCITSCTTIAYNSAMCASSSVLSPSASPSVSPSDLPPASLSPAFPPTFSASLLSDTERHVPLRILSWNINGHLLSNLTHPFFTSLFQHYDILLFQESHLCEGQENALSIPAGFTVFA